MLVERERPLQIDCMSATYTFSVRVKLLRSRRLACSSVGDFLLVSFTMLLLHLKRYQHIQIESRKLRHDCEDVEIVMP